MAGTVLLFGTMGHLQIDLNPANMIVLPLIMGIGVDGGVHVVHDSLHQKGRYEIGSTAFSAILVNTLTTMVGFGAMMIARHRGLYSLGLVLTLGVGACLLVSRRAPAVEAEALSSEPVSGLGNEPAVVFALSSAVPLASHQFATADVRAPRTGTYG
jgi:predicted exporter